MKQKKKGEGWKKKRRKERQGVVFVIEIEDKGEEGGGSWRGWKGREESFSLLAGSFLLSWPSKITSKITLAPMVLFPTENFWFFIS